MYKQLMLLIVISIMIQPFLFAEEGGQSPVVDPAAQLPVLAPEVPPSVPPVTIETSAGIGVIAPEPSDVRPVPVVAIAPSEGLKDTIQHMGSSAYVLQPPVVEEVKGGTVVSVPTSTSPPEQPLPQPPSSTAQSSLDHRIWLRQQYGAPVVTRVESDLVAYVYESGPQSRSVWVYVHSNGITTISYTWGPTYNYRNNQLVSITPWPR